MNGNPYQASSPAYHPSSQAASGHNGQTAPVGPGISGHGQYPYAVAHPAYSYPPYAQYPSMVMYGAAGPSHGAHAEQPSAEPSPPPSTTPTTGKRKRKYRFREL